MPRNTVIVLENIPHMHIIWAKPPAPLYLFFTRGTWKKKNADGFSSLWLKNFNFYLWKFKVGTSKEVILVFFSCFFKIYVNLRDTVIKDIFFFVCLFFLLTITGRNEAIIVELKELFV